MTTLLYVSQRVDIVFRRLLLEDNYSLLCEYDALVFSSLSDDGQYHQETRLCGSDLPDDLYFRHGPIKVEFTTDQDFALRGFNFHYNLNSIGKIVLIMCSSLRQMFNKRCICSLLCRSGKMLDIFYADGTQTTL